LSSLGSKVDASIRINTTGMMNEARRIILYLMCNIKKIRTVHQAKNDVASCALAMGICPALT
jgi:hypothetical protein